MARYAPETPATDHLHKKYSLSFEQSEAIKMQRQRVAAVIGGTSLELLAIIGACSMAPDQKEEALRDSKQLAELSDNNQGIVVAHRLPPWKPRTSEDAWWGMETTHPEEAYALLHELASNNANVAIELGSVQHVERYGELLAFAWQGARNLADEKLTHAIAMHDPSLSVAIKNGLDGELDDALHAVEAVQAQRQGQPNAAPATLLFRGGKSAQNPGDWGEQLLHAYDLSPNVIVDVAHGGEMAHDPDKQFGKSKLGQVACLTHLIEIARETGRTPAGVMIEASDIEKSWTDPVIPLHTAIELVHELAEIKQSNGYHENDITERGSTV